MDRLQLALSYSTKYAEYFFMRSQMDPETIKQLSPADRVAYDKMMEKRYYELKRLRKAVFDR